MGYRQGARQRDFDERIIIFPSRYKRVLLSFDVVAVVIAVVVAGSYRKRSSVGEAYYFNDFPIGFRNVLHVVSTTKVSTNPIRNYKTPTSRAGLRFVKTFIVIIVVIYVLCFFFA